MLPHFQFTLRLRGYFYKKVFKPRGLNVSEIYCAGQNILSVHISTLTTDKVDITIMAGKVLKNT